MKSKHNLAGEAVTGACFPTFTCYARFRIGGIRYVDSNSQRVLLFMPYLTYGRFLEKRYDVRPTAPPQAH